LDLIPTATRVRPPVKAYEVPEHISADEIFVLAARTALSKIVYEFLTKEKLDGIVNSLHGSVILEEKGVVRSWVCPRGLLVLPAWRLLQFSATNCQLFSLVQNWVLVEIRKLFWEYGPDEAV
jgi:hypothetical protein